MKYFISLALLLNSFISQACASLIEDPVYYLKSRDILNQVKQELSECRTLALDAQSGYFTDAAQGYFRQHLIAIERLNGKLHGVTIHTCPMDFNDASIKSLSTGQLFSKRTHGLIAGTIVTAELIELDRQLNRCA